MAHNRELDEFASIKKRLIAGLFGVAAVLLAGACGYYVLGHGDWSFNDCLYMTAITLSTVGFSETLDLAMVPGARLYTIVLIISGMGVIVYFGSSVVAFVVDGDIKHHLWRKRMDKRINRLTRHIIVCGAGSTGMVIIKELIATRTPFVAIDESEERLKYVSEDVDEAFPYVVGNASEDYVLIEAGIQNARGLVTVLPEDKDNLFVVVSARQLNQNLRIVSRGIEPSISEKLQRAGADSVVSPNFIGGMRMVSEMIRPNVVEFLDIMLKDRDRNLRVEEVTVMAGSTLEGQTLRQSDIRNRDDVLVIAARDTQRSYVYNPPPDFVLSEGTTLIVLANADDVGKLRREMS